MDINQYPQQEVIIMQTLTNVQGHVTGNLTESGNRIYLKTLQGHVLGYYDKSFNATYDLQGHYISSGNTLGMLIQK